MCCHFDYQPTQSDVSPLMLTRWAKDEKQKVKPPRVLMVGCLHLSFLVAFRLVTDEYMGVRKQ